jgi:membrane protein
MTGGSGPEEKFDDTEAPPRLEGRRGGDRRRVAPALARASARANELRVKAEGRIAQEDRASRKGVTIEWFARFRDSDSGLNSVLLAAFLFVTLVPALVVIASYVSSDPRVVSMRLISRLDLHGATADLTRNVLSGVGREKLVATLIAVASVVIFGLGIGRTLQVIYARIWRLTIPQASILENLRYLAWLVALVVAAALYVVELALLKEANSSLEWVFVPLWILGIVAFLAWTPALLLHGRVTWREALPGAVAGAIGLLGVRLISSTVFANWLNWYAKYYGGIGIAIALFFWLALITTVIIAAASLAPAYAARREARTAADTSRAA